MLKNGERISQTRRLSKSEDGSYDVVIPKSSVKPETDFIDIVPDFASANVGDKGYWIMGRGLYGTYRHKNTAFFSTESQQKMPIFGMKTPSFTFWGLIETLRFEYEVRVEAKDGRYSLFPRFNISKIPYGGVYEDIKISFRFLEGENANYVGMAKAYRNYRLRRGEIQTIKERIKDSPYLKKLAMSFPLRCGHMRKKSEVKDYNSNDEPKPAVFRRFDETARQFQAAKDFGLENLSICITSWQTGGDDGRCPSSFPVAPELGGEIALKNTIKIGQNLGYIIDGHSNFTDAYTCSPMWSPDLICKDKNGNLVKGGVWCGGQSYNLCLKAAWNSFLAADIEHIGKLGFRGAHYIDVFSATMPYACADKNHPLTRADAAKYQMKIAKKFRKTHGGFASECGFDHLAGVLDYVNYVSADMRTMRNLQKKRPQAWAPVDGFVPFWELVYHGIILSNPDKITQGLDLPVDDYLKLVEFGGRPIYYGFHPHNFKKIKSDIEKFEPLKYLQLELMENHEKLAENVFLTEYADGSKTIVNYGNTSFNFDNKEVPSKSYLLIKPKK